MLYPTIDPGSMRHQITILEQTPSSDESGSTVIWTQKFVVRGSIDIVRGLEAIRSGRDTTQIYATIKIWWQTGILPNQRIQAGDDTYLIQSIENVLKMNVVLVLNCIGIAQND
jgi:head-tail adaptor